MVSKALRDTNILLPVLTGRTHVTLNSQLIHPVGKYGLLGNPIQLELFEVGATPTGNDAVSPALAACFPPAGSGEPEGYPLPHLGLGSRVNVEYLRLPNYA